MKSSSANSPSFDKIASAFPSASPLILLFLHYIRRSFDPLSRLCRSFHRFSHPFTIQVKSFACKSRSSRSASQYPVAFAIMHFSSNSLSLSPPPPHSLPVFLSLRHATPLAKGLPRIPRTTAEEPLSSWKILSSPPNRVYLPNFPPLSSPNSRDAGWTLKVDGTTPFDPPLKQGRGEKRISTREHRLNLPQRSRPLKKLRRFVSPRSSPRVKYPPPFPQTCTYPPLIRHQPTGRGGKVNLRVDATRL